MKILDRYVLISFLLNYVIAFMVLVGLYVVLDMAFSLDEWAEFKDVSPTQVQQPTTQPGAHVRAADRGPGTGHPEHDPPAYAEARPGGAG
jgi:hypothetical protein